MLTQVEPLSVARYPVMCFEVAGGTSFVDARTRRLSATGTDLDRVGAVAAHLPRSCVERPDAVYREGEAERLADVAVVTMGRSGQPVAVDLGADGFIERTARVTAQGDFTERGSYAGYRVSFDDGSEEWYRSRDLALVMVERVFIPAWQAGGPRPYCVTRELRQETPVSDLVEVSERLVRHAALADGRVEPWRRYLFAWIPDDVIGSRS